VYRVASRGAQPVADGAEVTAVSWHPLVELNDQADQADQADQTDHLVRLEPDANRLRLDPTLYGLFVRSLLAEFGSRL
jgi:hypothetical protein